jgi:hypothetical protein
MNKNLIAASLFATFASLSLSAPGMADIVSCVEEVAVVESEIVGATPGDVKEKAWQKHAAAGKAANQDLCFSLLHEARLILNNAQGRSE